MTQDKAREYFSAYHEGTLEAGLRASFERKLLAEPLLQEEYDAFVTTVMALQGLRSEPIEVPSYLSVRIDDRLDAARAASTAPFWSSWFAPRTTGPRFVWATGLAAVALVAAVGLRGMNTPGVQTSGVVSGSTESVIWTQGDAGVTVTFAGGAARRVAIDAEGGEIQNVAVAAGQPLELTLSNPNRLARRFKVLMNDDLLATVAVPGSRPAPRQAGQGTVTEFASALADAYRVPVIVKSVGAGATVRWNFQSADARTAAEQGLDGQGNAVMMEGNVLQIGS